MIFFLGKICQLLQVQCIWKKGVKLLQINLTLIMSLEKRVQICLSIITNIKYFYLQSYALSAYCCLIYHAIYLHHLYFHFDCQSFQPHLRTFRYKPSHQQWLSITNPSQLASLFFIQLSRNDPVNFTSVVSVVSEDKILWADSTLYNRGATATGSISMQNTPHLRITIKKDIVRCPDDFKLYKCKMTGLDLQSNVFESETMPITIFYNS